MSRHIWTYKTRDGKTYAAAAGYDRWTYGTTHMQPHFFWDVEDVDAADETIVAEGTADSTYALLADMERAGVPYPPDLQNAQFDDAIRERMNPVTHYGADEPLEWPAGAAGYDEQEAV